MRITRIMGVFTFLLLLSFLAGCSGSSGGGSGKDASAADSIPKYVDPLVIPPEMPSSGTIDGEKFYEIAVKEFDQQVLPAGWPKTKVWGYGKVDDPSTFNYPGFTIETLRNEPVRVKWINGLTDDTGHYLKHLLPVDQTIEWANPSSDLPNASPVYSGPVPIVSHVHGAHVNSDSDGNPLAWFLPAAVDLPAEAAALGPMYGEFPGAVHEEGAAWYRYINDQPATTLWYHDHAMGITRLNVYAGLAGFWNHRDPANDPADLPGPSPRVTDAPSTRYYEIPLAIQDRSFNKDGSLSYPDSREYFDGFVGPYEPDSDTTHPVWNPEFFGETIVVNGKTWPYLEVEPRKYRFRLLNGCNSRFLILAFDQTGVDNGLSFTLIGNEGGHYPDAPLNQDELLLAPAERFDIVVDFSTLTPGQEVVLLNLAPDEPYKGWGSPENGPPADPATTGQVMKFKVVALKGVDTSVSPVTLPARDNLDLGAVAATRDLTLHEIMYMQGEEEYPREAKMGTLIDGPKEYMEPVTETPVLGTNEIWRIINFTGDAHPIHLHLTQFQVLDRIPIDAASLEADQAAYLANNSLPAPVLEDYYAGAAQLPYAWEGGYKETVIAPPGMVTRVVARFDLLGDYVWHCHILEHEDNEMMRPFTVVAAP